MRLDRRNLPHETSASYKQRPGQEQPGACRARQMTNNRLIIYFFVAITYQSDLCQSQHGPRTSKVCTLEDVEEGPVPHGLCGSQLSDIAQMICGPVGGFYSPGKRSELPGYFDINHVKMAKDRAMTFLSKRSQMMRGVVCECCLNTCSVNEIAHYCRVNPFRRRGKRSISNGASTLFGGDALSPTVYHPKLGRLNPFTPLSYFVNQKNLKSNDLSGHWLQYDQEMPLDEDIDIHVQKK